MFPTSLYRGMRLALFACTLAISTSAIRAQSVTLPRHLPSLLSSAQKRTCIEAKQQGSLALVLPLRNQEQRAGLLHRLPTPDDPMCRKNLTPTRSVQRSGPTQDYYIP